MRISAPALACAAVVLGGCASAPARTGSEADRVCIKRREINAISALDDRHAFVKLSATRFYLLTLEERCRGLRWARTIALEDSREQVCGDGSGLLSFDDPAVGPMRCRIERIESVANKGEAWELIESRAAPE